MQWYPYLPNLEKHEHHPFSGVQMKHQSSYNSCRTRLRQWSSGFYKYAFSLEKGKLNQKSIFTNTCPFSFYPNNSKNMQSMLSGIYLVYHMKKTLCPFFFSFILILFSFEQLDEKPKLDRLPQILFVIAWQFKIKKRSVYVRIKFAHKRHELIALLSKSTIMLIL